MDGSAINEIERMALEANGSKVVNIAGREYSAVELWDPRSPDPEPKAMLVRTLAAFVEYTRANRDGIVLGDCVIHIQGPTAIALVGPLQGEFHQRFGYIAAVAEDRLAGFEFGLFHPQETFVIGLLTRCQQSAARDALVALISKIRAGSEIVTQDDGVTQTVTTHKGQTMSAFADIQNPVTLAPYRTFPELTQPESPFLLRTRAGPVCALFEADGGAWRLQAIERIRGYLDAANLGLPVLG